jgi:uncharacterized protein involved in outer membrane biogenesis
LTAAPRSRRAFWLVLALAVAAIGGIAGLIGVTLDPARLKPRLVEAVQRETGRTLTIAGRIGIKLSLVPTISMEDVTFSNPPGFSRPDMVTVARVELGLALVPLLRHRFAIDRVTLVRPDILFETDPAGRTNWYFARQPARVASSPPATAPATPTSGGTPKQKFTVSFQGADIADARIGWLDGASGHRLVAQAPHLALAASEAGPVQLTGAVLFEGHAIELTAHADPSGTASWPVSAKLESGGASLTADGQVAHPLQGRGYALALDANVPDPPVFAPLLPGLPLASLKALTAHADINDNGGPEPTVSALRVNLGSVDLGKVAHGARLDDVSLTAGGAAPVKVATRVTIAGLDSAISGTIGDIPWLMHGGSGPVAVDLEWNAASGRASVKGTIQTPARFSGLALDVALDVPDPSLVAKDAPPALKSVVLRTHLTDASGPVPFQLTSNAGDLTGELSVTRVPRLSVIGRIASSRLDLDVLRPAPPAAVPATGATPAPAPAPAPEPPSPGLATAAPLIPDTKLPFALLRSMDANVGFSLAQVLVNGADVRGIDGVLAMKDGALRLDPFTIAAPDQRLSGGLLVDASKTPPEVHLSVDAPGLALRPLLSVLGLPQVATGTVRVQADLTGTGETPHAIAGSLDGWAGVAIEGGQLDAQMVNSWLGQLKPLRIGGADVTDLRCFAVRADAKSGVVAIEPLALNTAALILEGSGDVDLTHETLSLRVRPRAKIGGTGIALPLRIGGSMRAPSAKIDISANGPGGSGLAGLFLGGKDIMGEAGGGDPCPDALARARQVGQSGAR